MLFNTVDANNTVEVHYKKLTKPMKMAPEIEISKFRKSIENYL